MAAATPETAADDAGVTPLSRLDERYIPGPLGLLRRRPRLLLLAAGLLLLAGILVAVFHHGSDNASSAGGSGVSGEGRTVDGDAVAGPAPGTSIASYLTTSRKNTLALARDQPDTQVVALVTLGQYESPSQAGQLIGTLRPGKAYLRANLPAGQVPEVFQVPLSQPVADLQAKCGMVSANRALEARGAQNYVNTATDSSQASVRAEFAQRAKVALGEAYAYAGSCATVVAFTVEGTAQQVAGLLGQPGVRAVEVTTQPTTAESLQADLLLPGRTGTASPVATPTS